MRETIYGIIAEALAGIEGVQYVELWNNQLEFIEEEQPFLTPAVFIEFGRITWLPFLHGSREAELEIRLHVVTDSRVAPWSDIVEVFALLDRIDVAMHGIHNTPSNGTPNESVMDALTLYESITDHDFDELQENIEVFRCHVTDRSGYRR